jgi:hypothetical protein
MKKRCSMRSVAVVVLALFLRPQTAKAQDGVLYAPQNVVPGTLELTAAPLLYMFRERINGIPRTIEGVDDRAGVTGHLRYQLRDRIALVAKAEGGEDIQQIGTEVELTLQQAAPVSLVAGVGGHLRTFVTDFYPRRFAMVGLDAGTVVGIRASPRVRFYGAAHASFEAANVDLMRAGTAVHLGRFTRLNLIPGIEIDTKPGFHIVAEVGTRLNDRSIGYVAAGLRWRLRARPGGPASRTGAGHPARADSLARTNP